jgi:antitoxin component of MazEF toxin-antitoxin module
VVFTVFVEKHASKKTSDIFAMRAYNVRMNHITTTLTTSGNSVAVRLPKDLLKMSGLTKNVTLQAKKGQIIISKVSNPRAGWQAQIKKEVAEHGLPNMADAYGDMLAENEATLPDGLKK